MTTDFDNTKTICPISKESLEFVRNKLTKMISPQGEKLTLHHKIDIRPPWMSVEDFIEFCNKHDFIAW